ncbi:MAG TPA: oxygen-independent coproporphyrinogen III oxidase [bacterium]|nr:oxygen-independent coproporphyrinogen III oxidase [bacterium]
MTSQETIRRHFIELEPLLRQFDTSGPRYTSYPTAPQFTEAFGPVDWEAALARNRAESAGKPLSLYSHLPFCDTRCNFCGCYTIITENRGLLTPYLAALEQDIRQIAERIDTARPVVQFHLGGGTPNYLSPSQLESLVGLFQSIYRFDPSAEVAVEVDPRDLVPGHIETLHRLGFNRYSLGVQDFEPQVQEAVNRHQSIELTSRTVEEIRSFGHEAINLDLIYGLPYQTEQSFARTLDVVLALRPSRLALYSYAHVPWKSPAQRRFSELPRPEGPAKFALFLAGYHAFLDAGYVPIGFDHFALPEDELVVAQQARTLHRNFMGYTTKRGTDMLAHGVSAISDLGDTYAQNVKKLPDYYGAMERRELPVLRGYRLSTDDRLRKELIIDLTCNFALDIPAFEQAWGIDFEQYFAEELSRLEAFEQQGLVTRTLEQLTVEGPGRFFVRNLCMVFDKYLPAAGRERQFSRTL